jgi:hypothetical protein
VTISATLLFQLSQSLIKLRKGMMSHESKVYTIGIDRRGVSEEKVKVGAKPQVVD